MNWEAIGAISEAIGAIAIIASISYAAIQIRKNALATKTQSIDAFTADYNSLLMQLSENAELAQLLRSGAACFESLAPLEQFQFHAYLTTYFMNALNLHHHIREKTTEEYIARPNIDFFASIVNTPGGAEWWKVAKVPFNQDFVEHIDKIKINIPPANEIYPWFAENT